MESAPILDQVRIEGNVLVARRIPMDHRMRWGAKIFFVGSFLGAASFMLDWNNRTQGHQIVLLLLGIVCLSAIVMLVGFSKSKHELRVSFTERTVTIVEHRMFDPVTRYVASTDEIAQFSRRFNELALVWRDEEAPPIIMLPEQLEAIWTQLVDACRTANLGAIKEPDDLPFGHTAAPFALALSRDSISIADDIEPGHKWVYRSTRQPTMEQVLSWAKQSGYLPTGTWEVLAPDPVATVREDMALFFSSDRDVLLHHGERIHFRKVGLL